YFVGRREFAPAINHLEIAVKRSPRDLKALNLLGIALTGAGQIEKANQQFKKALRLNPRFYPALKNLAVNEATLKQTSQAKAHFEQVLKFATDDEVAHLYLGEMYFDEQQ